MDIATLRRAMAPTSVSDATLTAYLPHFMEAMKAAQITTVRRAAAWCSQIGHESAGLRYMAEIATDGPGWTDDRRIYRGRGPIQLTWSSNYRKFGQWCKATGYVTDSELFVNQPELVEQPKWGFLAASWYWLNGGPRPGQINGYADAGDILAVSRCINGWIGGQDPNGYADRKDRWNRCLAIGDQLLAGDAVPDNSKRPAYNAFNNWTKNQSSRGGVAIDCVFIHTQEPAKTPSMDYVNDGALNLSNFIKSTEGSANPVSYHTVASQNLNDKGVTVVYCADTDNKSWSVGNSNPRSLNYCFGGSFSGWTTEQWMQQSGAIDAIAWEIVSDCIKYGMTTKDQRPPVDWSTNYAHNPPVISDHRYCSVKLRDGNNHTDVDNGRGTFPWKYFEDRINEYTDIQLGLTSDDETTPPVTPPAEKRFPDDWTDRELMVEVLKQLRGPALAGWPQLGGKTLVDAVSELRKATS